MQHKDFIEIHDYSADEVHHIFELARAIKQHPQNYRDALAGQTLAMIFEKSSTRTRVSFEAGMFQLGGPALFLSARAACSRGGAPLSPPPRATPGRGGGSRSTTPRKSSRATSTASWPAPSRTR